MRPIILLLILKVSKAFIILKKEVGWVEFYENGNEIVDRGDEIYNLKKDIN